MGCICFGGWRYLCVVIRRWQSEIMDTGQTPLRDRLPGLISFIVAWL